MEEAVTSRRKKGGLIATEIDPAIKRYLAGSPTKPAKLSDQHGLFLLLLPNGAAHWRLKFRLDGKERQAALGTYAGPSLASGKEAVTLAKAREEMVRVRAQAKAGIDPVRAKKPAPPPPKGLTFKECAERYLKANEAGWDNLKHRAQWRTTLEAYAYPALGGMAVGDVGVADVLGVLEPLWQAKRVTAQRLRGRIEQVLDFAKVMKQRSGENPAAWRGNLAHLLSKAKPKVKHHAALDWREVGTFMAELRAKESIGARALEFAVLTAARSGEVRGMRWHEVDGDVWEVPGGRMKARVAHRVPLSDAALGVLRAMEDFRTGPDGLVFAARGKQPLSESTLTKVLERLDRDDITAHGFRSTFRTWAGEMTSYSREVVEMALAHREGDAVEQAYARGDLFEKRRRLMADWAEFCARVWAPAENVRPMRA
jgi:integrase